MCLVGTIYTLGAALCPEASIKITTPPRPRGQQTLSPLRRRDGAAVSVGEVALLLLIIPRRKHATRALLAPLEPENRGINNTWLHSSKVALTASIPTASGSMRSVVPHSMMPLPEPHTRPAALLSKTWDS
jgi:hypothetical protein